MKNHKIFIISFALLSLYTSAIGAIGQAAIITLEFPYGARSYAMGEVGAALADDESTVFWNPAGLGPVNERWHGGAITHFYEPLLPVFDIPDLWHTAFAICFQPEPSEKGSHFDIGGFGFFFNYLNFGESEIYDALGIKIGSVYSYEYVIALAWGFNFEDLGAENLSLGLTLKYAKSALAPGIGVGDEGIGRTVAIDAGFLYCFPFGMRIGFTLLNMGPPVFYISRDEADPIPFTIRLAFGYKKEFISNNMRVIRICAEYNLDRIFVYNEPYEDPSPFWEAIFKSWGDESIEQELSEIIHNNGFEITVFNTGSIRLGVMIDDAGSRTELHWGWGVSWLNHFNFDWAYIHSPRKSIARDGQWGVSFSFYRIFNWTENDHRWWEVIVKE